MERRQHHRYENLPISVALRRVGEEESVEVELHDIGLGGFYISSDFACDIYEKLEARVTFHVPGSPETMELNAMVWRVEPDKSGSSLTTRYMAFKFLEIDPEHEFQFRRCIDALYNDTLYS